MRWNHVVHLSHCASMRTASFCGFSICRVCVCLFDSVIVRATLFPSACLSAFRSVMLIARRRRERRSIERSSQPILWQHPQTTEHTFVVERCKCSLLPSFRYMPAWRIDNAFLTSIASKRKRYMRWYLLFRLYPYALHNWYFCLQSLAAKRFKVSFVRDSKDWEYQFVCFYYLSKYLYTYWFWRRLSNNVRKLELNLRNHVFLFYS